MKYAINTLVPYKVLNHTRIEYSVCTDYNHISRYKGLRQVVHNPSESDRFIAPETPNPFESKTEVFYYDVPAIEENRLDLIANKFLGSASYSWIISYFNGIDDGFTVREGQRLMIPKSLSSLFNNGEVLAPIPALQLQLGQE